jgi:hypothetical protein
LVLQRFLSISCCYIRSKPRDKESLAADCLLHYREREEELTPVMATLGFLVVLATAALLTGDGGARFFLTTVTKSPSEGFSPDTMDRSGSDVLVEAVIRVTTRCADNIPI